ncbi:MAG TPA: hypothetical protein VFT60_15225 [Bryobacteraceae bacterium]|nr:hypothetical protein [Bryobacteraceae bacterium]
MSIEESGRPDAAEFIDRRVVTPGRFKTLGVPLVKGVRLLLSTACGARRSWW